MMMKTIKVLAVCAIVAILGLLFLQLRAKTMVVDFLEAKIPSHINFKYDDLSVNILSGTVGFDNLSVTLSNRDSTLIHTHIKSKNLTVEDFFYSQFFMNNTIEANKIKLNQPVLKYYQHLKLPKKDTSAQGVVNLLKTIIVDEIAIENGRFLMYGQSEDSLKMSVNNINFSLYDAKTDPKIITKKMPIQYGEYKFSADTTFVALGKYEVLKVGKIDVRERRISINEIKLHSIFSKKQLSHETKTERDHIELQIPEIEIENLGFGFTEKRFFVSAKEVTIDTPHVEIYRDKLLADDRTNKAFYSQLLRELPIDIDIPYIYLNNGKLTYEESVHATIAPGKIDFNEVSASITGLTNKAKTNETTKVTMKAKLLGEANVDLEWEFNVGDESDAFIASGAITNFRGNRANSFLRPNLNAEVNGFIDQLYFTVEGNSRASRGDMKMKYNNFKFKVLNKDRSKVNKLLTTIGNIFINDGSKADKQGFRYGNIEVERDPSKSFFNYLWLNVRSGILSTLTGNGKKKD